MTCDYYYYKLYESATENSAVQFGFENRGKYVGAISAMPISIILSFCMRSSQ